MSVATKNTLLHGIRVLDMTRVLAGPFMTMILGDMGADVIKIEKPGEGDDARSWGPPFCGTESAYFLSVNRNKRSIAIDIKAKDGVELVNEMVKISDVFVENYTPGKLDSLGLGYENLKHVNPKLVYCSISGFGPTGPYAGRPGYDVIASSYGGLNYITGPEEGEPCKVGVALTDLCTGLYAHGAVLAALRQREVDGVGQKIDCDLLSTQIATLANVASSYLNAGLEARRWGTAHASIVPYQAFVTRDGTYLTVGATNNRQFKDLCDRMSLSHLPVDDKYQSNKFRCINRTSLIGILSERFEEKPCNEWLDAFEGATFPYGPINNMQQVFSDPHVVHNDNIWRFDHPTAGKGLRLPGPAVKYSRYSYPAMRPPPTLGQHSEEVLKELLDMSDGDISALIKNGIVA